MKSNAIFAVLFASLWVVGAGQAESPGFAVDRKIDSFQLQDFRGKTHSLDDLAHQRAIVIYFLGTECPLAKLYGPRVEKLYQAFQSEGVSVLGISSNSQDSITELAAHARLHQLTFPILKDVGNRIADRFGAQRTPQVFVLDQDRVVRYQGRVDAQFTFGSGVGLAQPKETRRDLEIALRELLAGDAVSVPVTEAKGCLIGRVRKANE